MKIEKAIEVSEGTTAKGGRKECSSTEGREIFNEPKKERKEIND